MTQEEKDLLLKDLCARLPYGVICYNSNIEINFKLCDVTDIDSGYPTFDYGYGTLESIKPYLRPMSSMTPEEFEEYTKLIKPIVFNKIQVNMANPESFDYLNKKMFDYRDLIKKGLAIEAPEGMYN